MRRVPIEDSFDLHSFRPEDVLSALGEYLREASARGFREVRLIHGKGRGIRRAEVQRWLRDQGLVEEFFDAPPERGGSGATVVVLRGSSSDPRSDTIPERR
jgi:DNA-nicking Smr family endonuclease